MITDLFTFILFRPITVFVLGVPELSRLVPVVTIVMLKRYNFSAANRKIIVSGFSAKPLIFRRFFGLQKFFRHGGLRRRLTAIL